MLDLFWLKVDFWADLKPNFFSILEITIRKTWNRPQKLQNKSKWVKSKWEQKWVKNGPETDKESIIAEFLWLNPWKSDSSIVQICDLPGHDFSVCNKVLQLT